MWVFFYTSYHFSLFGLQSVKDYTNILYNNFYKIAILFCKIYIRPAKKSLKGLFRRTSALRALTDGKAVSSHTCADRSVFCPGKPVAKNGFQLVIFLWKMTFSTSWGRRMIFALFVYFSFEISSAIADTIIPNSEFRIPN